MLILSKIFLLEIFKFSSVNSVNKLYIYPIGIVWLYLNFRYFKKKTDTITVEKTTKKELFLYLLFCLLIPLYSVIILSGGKIWK